MQIPIEDGIPELTDFAVNALLAHGVKGKIESVEYWTDETRFTFSNGKRWAVSDEGKVRRLKFTDEVPLRGGE